MPYCEAVLDVLPQYVADGEPCRSEYAALRDHLKTCMVCQQQLERMRRVEHGLRTGGPRQAANPDLTARILAAIAQESGLRAETNAEAWRLLPLDIWLPAVTLILAVAILALSIPEHLSSLASRYAPQPEVLQRTVSLPQLLAPYGRGAGGDSAFWALWVGLFVALAGLGLCISLGAWSKNSAEGLAQLEASVASWMRRLREGVRRAS